MSEQQSQPATGQNSTASSAKTSDPFDPNWREMSQQKWSTALGKFHLLGKMAGWQSIIRGMRVEDDVREQHLRANMAQLYGTSGGQGGGDDEMGHMVLGDYVINYAQPPQKPSLLSKVFPIVAGAAIAGGGIAAPFILDALKPDPVEQAVPSDVETDLGLAIE